MSNGVKITLIVILALSTLVVIPLFWGVGQYNHVVAMDEQVKSQWAQVENQLKRRYDLIPNLVETVKGYAKHEKELFENIANARTKYFQANTVKDKVQASQQLEGVLSRLLMLQENYPQLKANESFLKLQDSLEGTENRIAVERRHYNEVALGYNTMVRSFPRNIVANSFGFRQKAYFEALVEISPAAVVNARFVIARKSLFKRKNSRPIEQYEIRNASTCLFECAYAVTRSRDFRL